jgi:drug/metabolite transporter (DMT)-like permease
MNNSPRPRKSSAVIRGRLLVVIAAVLWSTSSLFAKSDAFSQWPREQQGLIIALWRAFFAGLVLLPLARRPQWSWKFLPMIVAFVAMNYTFLSAMVETTAANAIWLQHTAPVWVFCIGVFVFGETAQRSDWWLLVFCMGGVAFILSFELMSLWAPPGQSPRGVGFGLVAGFTYAVIVLSLRQLRAFDPAWLIALNFLVTTLVLAPFVWSTGYFPQGGQWLYLAGFGVFQMGLPYVIFARGVRSITGHEAAGIVLIEPVLVPVWALWHGEIPAWWTIVGAALILVGLTLKFAANRKEVDDSPQRTGGGETENTAKTL